MQQFEKKNPSALQMLWSFIICEASVSVILAQNFASDSPPPPWLEVLANRRWREGNARTISKIREAWRGPRRDQTKRRTSRSGNQLNRKLRNQSKHSESARGGQLVGSSWNSIYYHGAPPPGVSLCPSLSSRRIRSVEGCALMQR